MPRAVSPQLWQSSVCLIHKNSSFRQRNRSGCECQDTCDPNISLESVVIASVTSDEPNNSDGDGNTTNDIVIATKSGRELEPAIEALGRWAEKWVEI